MQDKIILDTHLPSYTDTHTPLSMLPVFIASINKFESQKGLNLNTYTTKTTLEDTSVG